MGITRVFPTDEDFGRQAAQQLAEVGIAIGPGSIVVLEDIHTAEHCTIHRRMVLPTAVGWSVVSPLITKGALPRLTMMEAVAKRPMMDCPEILALVQVSGAAALHSAYVDGEEFHRQLEHVLATYELMRFFQRDQRPGRNTGHRAIRPAGVDLARDEFNDAELRAWRRDFRGLPTHRQMLLATIICLYRGEDDDNAWLKGLPKRWHIADAVSALRDAGALADWGRLIALYPGW